MPRSLLLCVLLFFVPHCLADDKGSLEKKSQGWGELSIDGNEVVMSVESIPKDRKVWMPRVNNRLDQVVVDGHPDVEAVLTPEPEQWSVKLPKSLQPPLTVRVKMKGPVLLVDQPHVVSATSDKEIVLPAHHAETFGDKLRFEPQPHKNTIGYWTVPSDWAEWRFQSESQGTFELEVLQGCGTNQGGSEVDLIIIDEATKAKQTVAFRVKDTGHFQNFEPRVVGSVELQKGQYRLQVRPTKLANKAVCDIRQIRLTAKDDSSR